jgi:hypothetical protein
LCREHGQQLETEFAADKKEFGLFTVIKETVDAEGLMDFHHNYFPHDMYRDDGLLVFKAMGNRKIKLGTWNPFKIILGMRKIWKRLQEKGIKGNTAGEGLIMGGVLIFDKAGELKYAYEEEVGYMFDVEDIWQAVNDVRERNLADKLNREAEQFKLNSEAGQ